LDLMGWTEVATVDRLLEREPYLVAFEESLTEVRAGEGRLMLVGGEAGIGKTALVRRFCERPTGAPRILWGACDGLRTARPLGPFVDVAAQIGGPLAEALAAGEKPAGCFAALLRELESHRPTIVVLEDLQWADEATLDIVLMLGPRVQGVPALTIATYRDDGLTAIDSLRAVIGEVGTRAGVRRLTLPRLSAAAVEQLANAAGVDGAALHERTAGNPFFVSEVLAAGGGELPATVRDAVLARAARLTTPARHALDAVAVVPQPVEVPLLEELLGAELAHVDECLAAGMLQSERRAVAFRHELARLAVDEAIPAHRAVALHRNVLGALRHRPSQDAARLAHHAEAAGDTEAVLEFAPAAAARASSLGAHREAAAQLARALRFADGLAPRERAELHERRSQECHVIADFDDSIASIEAALDCYRSVGDREKEGAALRMLSHRMYCIGGREERAAQAARAAIEALEQLPPGPELARAYGFMASVQRDCENADEALLWGARANELAERFGDVEMRIRSLIDVGTMDFLLARPGGREKLEQALELARRHGHEERAGVIFINLAWAATRTREYDLADDYLRTGIEYCTARDLELHRFYLFAHRARVELDRGRWDHAAESASQVSRDPRSSFDSRAPALAVLGLVRARRGDPDPWSPLDDALALTAGGALQRLAPVAAARAEVLWLEGRADEVDGATAPTLAMAQARGATWVVGELACWRRRVGLHDELPDGAAAKPYARSLAGDHEAAARFWRELGCAYEAALALADGGDDDEAALREAHADLQAIGALPAAAIIARRLHARGARGVPRGPHARTRDNPGGLTGREVEVLELVAGGFHNGEIAERLVLSRRTVDAHVSAILRKLDARTRSQASAEAVRLGIARAKDT
jgi:DNA-binding CsgD family transcriptional regulator/tetratricopeptide (TPR) repeat protein